MFADHLAVGDEPAGGEDDPAARGDPQLAGMLALEAFDPAVQGLPHRGDVDAGLGGVLGELAMPGAHPRGSVAKAVDDEAGHALAVADQRARAGLRKDADAPAVHGLGEPGHQRFPRRTRTFDAVAARRGLRGVTESARGLAAGVVEVVVVARIGRLVGAQAAFERHAVALQPGDHLAAAVAEAPQRLLAHDVAGLEAQVVVHRGRGVLDSRVALLLRATARVDDAAAHGTRATARESLDDQDVRTRVRRFDGRARAGRAEPHDDHIRDELVHVDHPRTETRSRLW